MISTLRLGRAGKTVSSSEALGALGDGTRAFVCGGSAVPLTLLEAMVAERDRWTSLELVADFLLAPLPVFDYPNEPFRFLALQPSGAVKAMAEAGALTTAAVALSSWAPLTAPGGQYPLDAAIVHVSPPGPEGLYSLGVSVSTPLAAMGSAQTVIAQVNPQMPYTFGAGELPAEAFDFLVDADHALLEFPSPTPDDAMRTIGQLVAEHIPDGATLQLGLGALPEVVCDALHNHKRLSIHSGMISDGVVALHASGALAGSFHPTYPGKIATGLIGGTKPLFDFCHRNPEVVMITVAETHGLDVLRSLPHFRGINSAIEVSADGSINSERVGPRVVSGPGGAPDYANAAASSVDGDGKFIVALPATAAGGKVSRIVAELSPETPATVPGTHVDIVVTEYGVADITDLGPQDRANALRSITSPAFLSS